MAAILIFLAMVLNAAIYTETLATHETAGLDTVDASRYEHEAGEAVGTALTYENAAGNASYQTLHDNVSSRVTTWSNLSGRHWATDARATSVTLLSSTNGTRIMQNDTRSFTNVSDTSNWTLVDDATAVGNFTMTMNQSSLVEPTNTSNASELHDEGVFSAVYDNGSDVREVFVYANGTSNVTVRVVNASGVLSPGCEVPANGGNVTIDLLNGSVGGAACTDLDEVQTIASPYDISYRHGANANGTYEVVVDRPAIDDDLGGPDSGTNPHGERILYDVTVTVRYVGPALTYENTIRVPGGGWS